MIYTFYWNIYREAIMFYAHEVNEWAWPRVRNDLYKNLLIRGELGALGV